MTVKCTIFAVLLAFISSVACAQENQADSLSALSAWTNQQGSTLYIDAIDSNGRITGTYINRAAGFNCLNIPYPVTGWVYGTAIMFSTLWQSTTQSCNSITTWTGFFYQGQISTVWQLVINGSTSISQIINGKDTFQPSNSNVKKSLILEK